MFIKLIALYLYVTLLNFIIIICNGAVLSLNVASIARNSTLMNMGYNSVTESEDKLHPIIQTNNWLAVPTILTSTMTLLTIPGSRQKLDLRNNLEVNAKQKSYQLYTNLQTDNVHHHSGNNCKRQSRNILTSQSKLSTKSNSLSSLQSIKHNNLKSHIYPTNINNNKRTSNLNKENANLNTQMQMLKHIKSQVKENEKPLFYSANEKNYSVSAHSNSHHLTNVAKHKKTQNSSLSFTNWHYLPKSPYQAEDNIFVTPINVTHSTTATINLHVKQPNNNKTRKKIDIVKHSTNTILAPSSNSFKTNANWKLDNKLANVQEQQQKYKSTDEVALDAIALEEIFAVKQFLRKILKPIGDFYRNFWDIIWSHNSDSSFKAYDKDANYDFYSNSNQEFSRNDNDLQLLNSSSRTLNTDSATIATTLERMFPFDMENSLLSLATRGKGKGHKRHFDKGDIKYSVIKLPSAAAFLRKSYETQNKTDKAHTEKHLPILSGEPSTQKIHTSSHLVTTPTSKALVAVSAGRKMKKLKKKFKKFLLPLLLAYKLKFMTLIPLLISGLILLVGSTGLAGFFFALFTAVMSSK